STSGIPAMPHSYTNLLHHVIFSTQDRRPYLDAELQPRVFAYLGGILDELRARPILIGGMPDHVHILLTIPATLAVADALRVLKTNSSRWIHETWPSTRDFAWQAGYGAFSVSQSGSGAVKE